MKGAKGPIKVEVQGLEELRKEFMRGEAAIAGAIHRTTFRVANMVRNGAVDRIMKGPKSGRAYQRGKMKGRRKADGGYTTGAGVKFHRASAPGESPANDKGNLQRSIRVVKAPPAGAFAVAIVEANVPYAKALEYGTKRAGRNRNVTIEPRPFMQPAVAEASQKMGEIAAEEFEKATLGYKAPPRKPKAPKGKGTT